MKQESFKNLERIRSYAQENVNLTTKINELEKENMVNLL